MLGGRGSPDPGDFSTSFTGSGKPVVTGALAIDPRRTGGGPTTAGRTPGLDSRTRGATVGAGRAGGAAGRGLGTAMRAASAMRLLSSYDGRQKAVHEFSY